ncbi:MAG TPA: hypothetical protein VMB25_21750 [Bryobacteraceae bacterium]|nr:hypothetical protein [Bryobacteraceae bacterium]
MFKKMLQASAGVRYASPAEELNVTPAALPAPPTSERIRMDPSGNGVATKLLSFGELYRKSAFKAATSTAAWDILKMADMLESEHLRGLTPAAKHSALMMALEAAGVAVEDMLQDAVQRQRILNEYEEAQRRRLEEFENAKLRDNEKLSAEMEALCVQYRGRIAAGLEEIEHEREAFRLWQEHKEREQRRIAEAASACVSSDGASSDASVTRLLEKNVGRFRESA